MYCDAIVIINNEKYYESVSDIKISSRSDLLEVYFNKDIDFDLNSIHSISGTTREISIEVDNIKWKKVLEKSGKLLAISDNFRLLDLTEH